MSKGLAILLIDDDASFTASLSRFLSKEGHSVSCADSGEDGIELFRQNAPDIVLLDLVLPGIDGLETLEKLKQQDSESAMIVMTAHGSITSAVEAIRLGAADYLVKPIDLDALELKLAQTQQILGLRSDLDYLLTRERKDAGFENIIGSCPAMQQVYEKTSTVAKTDNTTVLVTGESGTGKELVSRAIHTLSARSSKPLMQIDCTSIPLPLLESELFGHEKGAFTNADRMKKGLLELADGGSLLLDEIGDMDPVLQGKFLRVLQERQFRRVGGTRDIIFDVRVIAATNQDLHALSEKGMFRRDLLYRLKVFQIELPPLRERENDVLELASAFMQIYSRNFRKTIQGFSDDAIHLLTRYLFPGNVRELRNVIEQAVILAKGDLITRELLSIPEILSVPPSTSAFASGADESPRELSIEKQPQTGRELWEHLLDTLGEDPLVAAERKLLATALRRTGGNKKRAAEILGISRFALQRKLEKLPPDFYELD